MATTFDGDNLLITLNAGGSVHTVDAQQDLYSEWKEWVKLGTNSKYPPAFRTTGGDPLTPGITAGAYFFLRNDIGWRIKPAEEDATITLTGNLAPEDSTLPVFEPTTGLFTVAILGLQPITQNVAEILEEQQNSQYGGKVVIDTVNGTAGTNYPQGLYSDPVNNITDAKAILARVGGNKIEFIGSLGLDQDLEGYNIFGSEAVTSNVLTLNGYSLDRSYVESCFIAGDQGGTVVGFEAYKCGFQTVTNLCVGAERCAFFGNVTLKLNSTNIWFDCKSGVAGNLKPQISGNGGDELHVRGWIGGFDLRSVSNSEFACSIDFTSGRLALQSTITAGDIVIGGTYRKDLDAAAGTSTVSYSGIEHYTLERILKATAYRQFTNAATGNLDIFKDDNTLDQSVPIYEDDGTTSWDGAGPIVRRDKIT